MPQHQNLDVLRRRIPPGQPQPREHPSHDQIDQLQPHDTTSSQLAAIIGTLRSNGHEQIASFTANTVGETLPVPHVPWTPNDWLPPGAMEAL